MGFPLPDQGSSGGNDGGGSGGAPQGGSPGVHPAWNDMLGAIPQEYHSQVIPHLQRWDQNTNKVHQRYEPYKEFVDNGYQPDQIRQALAVAKAIENDPRAVYELFAQEFGNVPGQQQQQNGQGQGLPGSNPLDGGNDFYEGLHPKVVEQLNNLQNGFDTVAQIMLSQRQQSQEAEEDAQLAAFYKNLEATNQTFRDLNKDGAAEPYINFLLEAGYEEDQAVQLFEQFVESVGAYQNRPKPPVVLGAGGGLVPTGNGIDPRKMNPQQTRNLVADTLKAYQQSNQ